MKPPAPPLTRGPRAASPEAARGVRFARNHAGVLQNLLGAAVALLVAGAGGYLPYALRRAVYPFVESTSTSPASTPVPLDAVLVHAWAAFDYRIEAGRLTWALARLLVERPASRSVLHSVRRTFFAPS